jgi:hypothetical protein
MKSVIYIMGRGHSGSTVLDCLLDNAPGVQGIGESVVGLTEEFRPSLTHQREQRKTKFWNEVRASVEAQRNDTAWEETVEAYKSQAHISNFFKTLKDGCTAGTNPATIQAIRRIYNSVKEVSGERVIVDSSKEITRGLLMAKCVEEAVVIHLVRDPRSVLASDMERIYKKGKFRFLRKSYDTNRAKPLFALLTCLNWVIGNTLCEIVKAKYPEKTITVRYESLKSDPEGTLERIASEVPIDFDGVYRKIENEVPMSTGIGLSGNRMRRGNDEFVFETGRRNRELPYFYKKFCSLITYPLRKTYGYVNGGR